ncbi:MAG: DUF2163 domain-containing protein [Rhizobiaceae bacterium]
MTAYPPELLEHLAEPITTLCHCWRLVGRDGSAAGFTDHDRTIGFAGSDFRPRTGFTGSEARSALGLAVETVDIEGALASVDLVEDDIEAGLLDGATVETFLVNWRDPTQRALIRKATIGKITRRDGQFVAELESLTHALDRPRGRYIRRTCDAEVGDGRCGVNLAASTFRGTGAVSGMPADSVLSVSGLGGFGAGWFSGGVLSWTSGQNLGRIARVTEHRRQGTETWLTLWPDAGHEAEAGDEFTVTAGCDKSFATCKAKFDNPLNFRGFPHLPGNDAAYGYVTEGQVFDGRPIVP